MYRVFILLLLITVSCQSPKTRQPTFQVTATDTFLFNNFVDCNMAEAWVGDTFRIFPGKYGEDPLWGYSHELKFASGKNADEVFLTSPDKFTEPTLPPNVLPGADGLHGAIWFETVYQSPKDTTGKTLYAVYHNENYPITLPYNPQTRKGYTTWNWPQGITGPTSPAAVCRIGIMQSTNGGHSWANKGIFLEDDQPRLIMKPHNTSLTFAGGVGDPSAVASGEYLYLFYGEYGYPGVYDPATYDSVMEASGQCISIARMAFSDLDNPQGKAKRWDGEAFSIPYDGVGRPVVSLQIPVAEGGGHTSSPKAGYYWGPSVSWNEYLQCWVMLMAKATGPSWAGNSVYISFNPHKELGTGKNAQDWTKPVMLLEQPGYFLWYPSLQPLNTPEDIARKYTSMRLGKKARLFIKYIRPDKSEYLSAHVVDFSK